MKILLRSLAALLCLAGLACVAAYFIERPGTGKLMWDSPIVRKSLMTFAYKVYGDPGAQNGRYFLSKLVFRNEGAGSVRDFSISYQIPDYVPWTTPETHSEIPAGQTVVKLYYPSLPAKVTQLSNQTNATLETKIRWSDKQGETREEILRSNIALRGVNEIEYTDLPQQEILTWYDVFVTTPFATAMVTPNDPVVKEFSAEVTRRLGGTTAGAGGGAKEIVRLMKGVYDYMCETGMRYTSDSGVPSTIGDVRTMVQTVRLPRDVIITNQGLCIELALLWASVMEHLGCPTTVVFRPGHAFTLVWVGQGPQDFVPIECTAITPMAVGANAPVPFEQAVKMASEDLQKQKYQIWVNVQDYQKQGFRPPELPPIEIDKIKGVLTERNQRTAASYASQSQPPPNSSDAQGHPLRQGYYRWQGASGMVSIDIPASWMRMENTGIPGMVFTAQDPQTSVAVNAFYFPQLASCDDAMRAARQGVAKTGATVKVASQKKNGATTYYTGTTSSRAGANQWVGVFQATQGGVIGLFTGSETSRFASNQPIIQDIISSARFLNGSEEEGGGE